MTLERPSHISVHLIDGETVYLINFRSLFRGEWLSDICSASEFFHSCPTKGRVIIVFPDAINTDSIEPVHLVTLACLIQYLADKHYAVSIGNGNKEVAGFILRDLRFSEYWAGGKNHVDADTGGNIFNLWRIVESEKEFYAHNVEKYLNNTDFKNKDLSALNVALVEAFYNVFDHAQANNNAFLFIRYDKPLQRLYIAISDFGIGIVKSVRRYKEDIATDHDAIYWSVKDHSTVKSTPHNKGLGMGNILAVASVARIVSGAGLLLKIKNEMKKFYIPNFCYPGTLIYLEVDMTSFDNTEILESFNW